MARPPAAPPPPTTMTARTSARPPPPLSLSLGPERKVYLHSSDPNDHPGLRFVHSPADGRVRVSLDDPPSSSDADSDDHSGGGMGRRYDGIVEGEVRDGDVVREMAGIDARRPISEHMWKLTLGLMRVAPRPIEVVVATERDDDDDEVEEEESRMMVDSSHGGWDGGGGAYYQLDVKGAAFQRLPGGVNPVDVDEETEDGGYDDAIVGRDPFQDVGRFGPERRVVFLHESLGVKLHRSPEEGIVRVLGVTYAAAEGEAREGRDDSHGGSPSSYNGGGRRGKIEPGDTIFEVGGVDLRNKHIGAPEWADMVHFIKHVGRPLEMVVAKDGTFVAPPPTTTAASNTASTTAGVAEEEEEQREEEVVVVEEEGGGIFDNVVCFSIRADEICNLPPCPDFEDGGIVVCGVEIPPPHQYRPTPIPAVAAPGAADGGGDSHPIEEPAEAAAANDVEENGGGGAAPRKAHPWDRRDARNKGKEEEEEEEEEDNEEGQGDAEEDDDDSVYAASVAANATSVAMVEGIVPSPGVVVVVAVGGSDGATPAAVAPTPKPIAMPTTPIAVTAARPNLFGTTVAADAPAKGTAAYVPFYSRTHPGGGRGPSSPSSSPPRTSLPRDDNKLTVAQLREKFSPIKNPGTASAVAASVAATVESSNPRPTPNAGDASRSTGGTRNVAPPPSSPVASVRPRPRPEPVRQEEVVGVDSSVAKWKGLFSPMAVPGSPSSAAPRADPPENRGAAAGPVAGGSGSAMSVASGRPPPTIEDAADVAPPPDPARMSPRAKREELARMIVKEKRAGGDARRIREEYNRSAKPPPNPDPEPSPTRPFDEPCSPVGSTVSVENDKKDPCAKQSNPDHTFGERFDFGVDSPFVGNIKFATPTQRVPSSALFSRAFVVQPGPAGEGPANVRWVQTSSPLFVTRKTNDDATSSSRRTLPPRSGKATLPDPKAKKAFDGCSFDLTQLDWNDCGKRSLADAIADPEESESPSFDELNETIVYADSTEEAARVDCCSISDVLGGFAQDCGIDPNPNRAATSKVPSPRRKNLLSRIRNKKKHPNDKKVEYGNLVEDDDGDATREGTKGIRNAHVQLAYQNIRGKTTAKASQFTLLVDDEICF